VSDALVEPAPLTMLLDTTPRIPRRDAIREGH
jgi:hypothetical protein